MSEHQSTVTNCQTTSLLPDRANCTYTKCFCEENVWKLCEYIQGGNQHGQHLQGDQCKDPLTNVYVVFISNFDRKIPIWSQQSACAPAAPVVWDYHVILLHTPGPRHTQVYDLDSTLSFPASFQNYLLHALKSDNMLKPQYHRRFRVVPGSVYLRTFASSRDHMINKETHKYMAPPPDYEPIKTETCDNNIEDFISMEEGAGFGTVMDMPQFVHFFNT